MSGLSGRFISRDPIGFEGQQMSLYTYVNNQPHTSLDPSGLFTGIIFPPESIWPYLLPPDDWVSITFIVFDVVTVPSGEGPVLACGYKTVARTIRQSFKKKGKDIAECEMIYQLYKGGQDASIGCLSTTTCADAVAASAGKATEVAMRGRYLGKRCDYILPDSIRLGSAGKEANHRIELGNATNRLAKCSAHAAAVCAKENPCCGKP